MRDSGEIRLSWTLARYQLRETLLYGALGVLLIISVMLSQNVLAEADTLFSIRMSAMDVASLLGWIVTGIAAHALPVAFLFGALLATSRLCSDGEVLAMRANGVGLRQLVVPVLALALLVAAIDAVFFLHVEHRAYRHLRDIIVSVAARGAMLEPERFHRLGTRVIYVHRRDRDNRLRRILISDDSDPEHPYVLLAARGSFSFDAQNAQFHFNLADGELHVEPREDSDRYRRIRFDRLDYVIDASWFLVAGTARLRPGSMSFSELRQVLARARAGDPLAELATRNPRDYELEIQRRFAMPFAPIALGLLAIPLGLRRARGARSWGALACVGLVAVYYFTLTFTQLASKEGWLPPPLAFWGPNLLYLALGIALLRRVRKAEV
jgi:lipopolysaccharide export system permease protein